MQKIEVYGGLKPAQSLEELAKRMALPNAYAFAGFAELDGIPVYVKLRRLKPSNKLRQIFRGSAPWTVPPRLVEAQNLQQLAALGLGSVEVLAVGWHRRFGLLERELLVTRKIPNAVDLATLARSPGGAESISLESMLQVGLAVGRMHKLGFRHRDLFLRNILLCEDGPHFIDCRRGSMQGRWTRDFVYDLAAVEKWAASLLSLAQREAFFVGYLSQRDVPELATLLQQVDKQRRTFVNNFKGKRRGHRSSFEAPTLEVEALSVEGLRAAQSNLSAALHALSSKTPEGSPV
jgi:tRNA A-37 threonylcarbamoyl transferase component Bud32